MLRILCLLAVVLAAKSASAPFIKPCKLDDNACAVASAQAAVPIVAPGIPEMGINSLDPMNLPLIKGDQAGLKLTFKDTTVTGMKGCVFEAVKYDTAKNKQLLTIRCSVDLKGDYNLDGQILVLPIRGQGKYNIQIRDIIIKTAADMKTVTGADGQPHWEISSIKHTYQVKTGARFLFQNLFNGNKILAEPVEEFVNTNWRDVMQEIAPPVVRAIVEEVIKAVKAFYAAVPADQLYIN